MSSEVPAFLSAEWYRVARLKPRLRGHVEIHRQIFRGETWYVLQDSHSGKYHRITEAGNYLLALMNGRRTMHDIWETACDRFSDEPPTQADTLRLLSQLHSADLIAADLTPHVDEIATRGTKQTRRTALQYLRNPLALRLPLFDPDNFLAATVHLVRWLFTPFGFLLWLALVGTGVVLAALNWSALTDGLVDQVLAAENLLLIALAYPLVKIVHELGHGYAAKVWGGEVREVGLMFLIFIPVPYVDASSSAAFPSKWRRAVVGGAGIMVELALAAIALIFWIQVEPGFARAFAFNVMLIGGVSTLLFNGNPLLRFDGYFVMADLLEIPNMGQRSNKYFWYLVQRHLLRIKSAKSPVTARGEAPWMLSYAVLAFIYKVFISITIALFVASKYFVVGIVLALWTLFHTFVLPIYKGLKFLFGAHQLRGQRGMALASSAGVLLAFVMVLFAWPLPYATVTHGVVWLEQEGVLRAGTEGLVEEVTLGDGLRVAQGAEILRLSDPALDSRIALLELRLTETEDRLRSVPLSDQVQSRMLKARLDLLRDQLVNLLDRQANLRLTAPGPGRVVVPDAQSLTGRMVQKGDVLGYLLDDAPLRLRVAVPQATADLVRTRTLGVEVLFHDALDAPVPARLVGEVPQSQDEVPSLALSTRGGGDVVLNPAGLSEYATLQSVFVFDVAPETSRAISHVGARALVRFDHGPEPIGQRMYRAARQLFLTQFRV